MELGPGKHTVTIRDHGRRVVFPDLSPDEWQRVKVVLKQEFGPNLVAALRRLKREILAERA